MAECKFAVKDIRTNPYVAHGPVFSEVYCTVHHQAPNQSGMCPIGQIEKATEEALAKIAAAANAANR